MKYGLEIIVAGISIVLLGGCASTPNATGYLSNYEQLHAGKYLEKYWADTGSIQKGASPTILLGTISVDKISDQKGISVADCVTALKADLKRGGMISEQSLLAPIRLDLAITEMTPGNAAQRITIGGGYIHLQIEGKVVDVESGRVLAAFAERHTSTSMIGIEDLAGSAGPSLVKHLIKISSERINKELSATFSL